MDLSNGSKTGAEQCLGKTIGENKASNASLNETVLAAKSCKISDEAKKEVDTRY